MDSVLIKEMASKALRAGALRSATLRGTIGKEASFQRYWIIALKDVRTADGTEENVFGFAAGSSLPEETFQETKRIFYNVIQNIGRNSANCPSVAGNFKKILAHEVHILVVLEHGIGTDGAVFVILRRHPLLHPIRAIALLHDTAAETFTD